MRIFKTISAVFLVVICLLFSVNNADAQDTCYATFDLNQDSVALTIGDMVYLIRMLNNDTTLSDSMHLADINGDCVIDDGDIEKLYCFFTFGFAPCFPEFPVPTCCDPLTTVGACCLEDDSCTIRSEDNCAAIGGEYLGDGTTCIPENPCSCCKGIRGNADCDLNDEINVADIIFMIQRLFIADFPCCELEEDVDGTDQFNVADVIYLIDYIFRGGPPPVPCFE